MFGQVPQALNKGDEFDVLDTHEKFLKAYGDDFGQLIVKADAPLLTSTSGVLYRTLGVKLWTQLNTEQNLWAILRKETWGSGSNFGGSGWRVITAYSTNKGQMLSETDNLPDSDKPSFSQIFDDPKTADRKFDASEAEIRESSRMQAVVWQEYARFVGIEYMQFICEELAAVIGDNGSDDFNPIDQIISSYSEYANCATVLAKTTAASTFYNSTVVRTSAGWYDAYVLHNSETLRPLTPHLIDDLIEGTRALCGLYSTEGYIMVTGTDTQKRMSQLLRSHKYIVSGNGGDANRYRVSATEGLRAIPGEGFGFSLDSYDGIPIFVSKHVQDSLKPSGGLTPVWLMHLPSISFWVDVPIVYQEHGTLYGEDILVGAHKQIGLYHMRGNVHAYYFLTNGKLRDIEAV